MAQTAELERPTFICHMESALTLSHSIVSVQGNFSVLSVWQVQLNIHLRADKYLKAFIALAEEWAKSARKLLRFQLIECSKHSDSDTLPSE